MDIIFVLFGGLFFAGKLLSESAQNKRLDKQYDDRLAFDEKYVVRLPGEYYFHNEYPNYEKNLEAIQEDLDFIFKGITQKEINDIGFGNWKYLNNWVRDNVLLAKIHKICGDWWPTGVRLCGPSESYIECQIRTAQVVEKYMKEVIPDFELVFVPGEHDIRYPSGKLKVVFYNNELNRGTIELKRFGHPTDRPGRNVRRLWSDNMPFVTPEPEREFDIVVELVGDKIKTIRIVRELTGLGLKEAKELVESAPFILKRDVKEGEAETIKKSFEDIGTTVILVNNIVE